MTAEQSSQFSDVEKIRIGVLSDTDQFREPLDLMAELITFQVQDETVDFGQIRGLYNSPLTMANNREIDSTTQLSFAEKKELVETARIILKDQQYVSVQVKNKNDKSTLVVHLTIPDLEKAEIHFNITSDDYVKNGARYSSLEGGQFPEYLLKNEESVSLSNITARDILDYVRLAKEEVAKRYSGLTVLQFDTQGFHERQNKSPYTGTDTGGQTAYCELQSVELAKQGFNVTIINRGGPDNPVTGEVRMGMHYYADGVDIFFPLDGNDEFVRKEDMYPVYDFNDLDKDGNARSVHGQEGIFKKLAEATARALNDRKIHALIGHYIDGAAVAREFYYIREAEGNPIVTPKIPFIAHSLGALKRFKLSEAGGEIPATHNFERRIETETQVLSDPIISGYDVSPEIEESMIKDYYQQKRVINKYFQVSGKMPALGGSKPAGVDVELFQPRTCSKTDPRYDAVWIKLARYYNGCRFGYRPDGRMDQERVETAYDKTLLKSPEINAKELFKDEIAELQASTIIFEASRTIYTKGKDTIIKAFAEMKKQMSDRKLKLVINISNPYKTSLQEEKTHAAELLQLIQELELENDIIYTPSFPLREVAMISQVADLYMTGASMETWGMSVQQAAACKLPIVSSRAVPIATGPLYGTEYSSTVKVTEADENGIVRSVGTYSVGEGVVVFDTNSYKAAAAAAVHVLTKMDQYVQDGDDDLVRMTELEAMTGHAFSVASSYNWSTSTRELMEDLGYSYKEQHDGLFRVIGGSEKNEIANNLNRRNVVN